MCRHSVLSEPQLVKATHQRPALPCFVQMCLCALFFLAQAFVAHLVRLVQPETPIPQIADSESVARQGRLHLKQKANHRLRGLMRSWHFQTSLTTKRSLHGASTRKCLLGTTFNSLHDFEARLCWNTSLAFFSNQLSVEKTLQLKPLNAKCVILLVHVEGIEC